MLKDIIPVTISANLIKQFAKDKPIFVSGRLLALMILGKDNEGLITRREYLQYFNTISIETGATLIADAQSGFGNELSVWTAINEIGNAGAKYVVLNDQIWPSSSIKIKNLSTKEAFISKVNAAVDGGKNYNLQVIPKLDGIRMYGYQSLVERIQALLQMGIKQIIVSHITFDELLSLKTEQFFKNLGISLDDATISLQKIKESKPTFILPVQPVIKCIDEINEKILYI